MQLRKNSVSSLSLILRCGAAGLLAVWGGDSGWVCGAFLESAVWVERRRGAEVHGADPGSRDWDGLFYCAVLWIGCGKIHESGCAYDRIRSGGPAKLEPVQLRSEQADERDRSDRPPYRGLHVGRLLSLWCKWRRSHHRRSRTDDFQHIGTRQ